MIEMTKLIFFSFKTCRVSHTFDTATTLKIKNTYYHEKEPSTICSIITYKLTLLTFLLICQVKSFIKIVSVLLFRVATRMRTHHSSCLLLRNKIKTKVPCVPIGQHQNTNYCTSLLCA